jgi:cation-transporting ATPase E
VAATARSAAGAGASAHRGLTEAQAAARLRERPPPGAPASSRSYRSIVVANLFTVFNLILLVAGVATLTLGDWRDALFLGILVANTSIGIAQEVRAKRALDRLAALVTPTATALRDGHARSVRIEEVVVGDLLLLEAGDQVVADGELVQAAGLALDEAILTGESQPVPRTAGEAIRSGSFVAEGAGRYVVRAVGSSSYAQAIAGRARAFRHPRSPLELALNRLLILLVVAMVPLGAILATGLVLRHSGPKEAVATGVAGALAMVPEGLLLLAGLTAAVAALRMSRRGVLAQQLNAVESLASVDVICLDKTGTLTDRRLRLVDTVPADGVAVTDLRARLAAYADSWARRDETLDALAGTGADGAADVQATVPFSSHRRWSAVQADGVTTVLGAPELFSLGGLAGRCRHEVAAGRRVLALGWTPHPASVLAERDGPPPALAALGLAVLSESLRPEAAETVAYLRSEGVALKILSGDAPATAAAIAADLGLADAPRAFDGRRLPDDPEALSRLAEEATVIGRISPDGKQRVVEALRDGGHYVAMVGDGVNDVPALKAARLAIAQGSGADMARAVADLVLVDGDFAAVPALLAQGRQTLRNVQRVAKLFVSKSIFAAALIVTLGVAAVPYPFLPRHLSLVSSLSIGIPAFFLALAPSSGRWEPTTFLRDVARFSVPGGLGAATGVLTSYVLAIHAAGLSTRDARTVATTALLAVGLWLVLALEHGSARRITVVGLMCAVLALAYVSVLAIPWARAFFELASPDAGAAALAAAGGVLGITVASAGLRIARGRGSATAASIASPGRRRVEAGQ